MPKIVEDAQKLGDTLYGAGSWESMQFECAQSLAAAESGAVLFTDVSVEGIECEAATDAAKRLAEKYTFLERASLLNIPEARDAVYTGLEQEGSKPLYILFEMPGGFSKVLAEKTIKSPDAKPTKEERNRFWPDEVIHDFAEQIRKRRPVGYMGHADMWTFTQLPENIPVQWETAIKAKRKSDGQAVTLARGYAFDYGMNRAYLTAGAIDSASVNTVGSHEMDTTDEKHPFVRVKSAALISFDLVRKHLHGIPGTRRVENIITQTEASAMELSAEQKLFVAELDAETVRKYNPDLVQAFSVKTDAPVEITEMSRTIRELTTDNVALSRRASVAEQVAQKLNTDPDKVVAAVEALLSASTTIIESAVNAVASRIKAEGLRKAVVADLTAMKLISVEAIESEFVKVMDKYRGLANEMAMEAANTSAGSWVVSAEMQSESLTPNAEDM